MARISAEGMRNDVVHVDRPIAIKGALPANYKCENMLVTHLSINDSEQIAENLEKLWTVDEVRERSKHTDEEELCMQIFNDTVTRSSDGRYIVTMPVVKNPPKFGNALRATIARQFANERRFRKYPELKEKYVKDIQQFIDMDHMELVPPDEIHSQFFAISCCI